MASTSLIHETDLVVSINDLDNLFNSDEDDLAVSRDLGLTLLWISHYKQSGLAQYWCVCVLVPEQRSLFTLPIICWQFLLPTAVSLIYTRYWPTGLTGARNGTGMNLEQHYELTLWVLIMCYNTNFFPTAWFQTTSEWNGREIWRQGTKAIHFGPCVLH